ncbi:MAG: hypothetical protein U0531_15635 [Dehalococcoidia bacterium]
MPQTPMWIERRGPIAALGRSQTPVRRQWWRAFAVGASVVVLYLMPGLLLPGLGSRLVMADWRRGAGHARRGASFLGARPDAVVPRPSTTQGQPARPASPSWERITP